MEEDEEALNIVFGGNAGAVWHSEVHVHVDTVIDLSDLTFSLVSTSVGSATLDALHVEVAIFVIFFVHNKCDFLLQIRVKLHSVKFFHME